MDLIVVQLPVLEKTAYNKHFCFGSSCPANVGEHTIIDLATDGFQLITHALTNNICTRETVRKFASIVSAALVTVSTLNCPVVEFYQRNLLTYLRNFLIKTKTEENVRFQIPVLEKLLTTVAKVNLAHAKTATPYNALYLLKYLIEAYEMVDDIQELINTGLLYIPFAIAAHGEDSDMMHRIVYLVALNQRKDEWKLKFTTPYDYLRSETANLHGLELPENIDYAHVLCVYLRLSNHYIIFSNEFNNKIIHQLLLNAGNSCPSKYLPFVLYTSNFCYKPIEQMVRNIINTPSIMAGATDKLNAYQLGLIKGAFKLVDYFNTMLATDEKYRKGSLADDWTKPESEMYNDLNLPNELAQKQILLYCQDKFTKFIDFYMKLEAPDKELYKEEIKYLARELPRLAREFSARFYHVEAAVIYWNVYQLYENDEINEVNAITACSYFLENPIDYQEIVVGKKSGPSLQIILDTCNGKIANQLKSMENLSARKQIQIYVCMLNMALYYVSQNRISDGQLLLKFIDSNMDDKIHSSVRLKYDYTVLQMTIKHQMGDVEPWHWACEMITRLIKMMHLMNDEALVVATIMFKTITDLSAYSYHRHLNITDLDRLAMAAAKYSLGSGQIIRTIKLLNTTLLTNVAREKPEYQVNLKEKFACCFYLRSHVFWTILG